MLADIYSANTAKENALSRSHFGFVWIYASWLLSYDVMGQFC